MIEIDSIKRSYEFSNDFVFMLDSDLKLYWFNNEAQYKEKRNEYVISLISNKISKSKETEGTFWDIYNDLEFSYNIVKLCLQDDSLFYIVQCRWKTDENKTIFVNACSKYFVSNQATIRQSVFGICNCLNNLKNSSTDNEFNLVIRNCYSILKVISIQKEIYRYSYGQFEFKTINLKDYLIMFKHIYEKTYGTESTIELDIDKAVSIIADEERLTFILLLNIHTLFELNCNKNSNLVISVKIVSGEVLLAISTNKDNELENPQNFIKNYSEPMEELMTVQILKLYREVFETPIYLKNEDIKTVAIKYKIQDNTEEDYILNSKISTYLNDRFSEINIALSNFFNNNFFRD